MMWHSFFNKIFLISLDHCKTDNFRLPGAESELKAHGIPYEIYPAYKHENGAFGCFYTYKSIFSHCIDNNIDNVLIFEDDIKIIGDINFFMAGSMENLPTDYHTLHFGPNTHQPIQWAFKPFFLTMHQCRSTHAQAYSIEAMRQIVKYEWTGIPIDQMVEEKLQPQGKCYCTYPLLVTQRNGYSDIDKQDVNMYYIEDRFHQHTKHLAP